MVLLSINAGSSSLKVAVFDEDQLGTPRTSVSIEGIGSPSSSFIPEGHYGDAGTKAVPIADIDAAVGLVKSWLTDELSIGAKDITALGHRIVHGGPRYTSAVIISDPVISYLQSITDLAPNHMPGTLRAIGAFRASYPEVIHVGCFDTSFFSTTPKVAKTLPIAQSIQEKFSLQRYGFHGLSYQSLLSSFAAHEGEMAKNGRVIMAHLGNGASVSASRNGQPIDMTMGFTPVSGIMMSTRSGDLEPGVLTYLQTVGGMSVEEVEHLVAYESGLQGVSELSGNMHDLLDVQHDNPRAALAVELFCYKVKKQIGAYAAALGGVDSIIFSGGIGERSAEVRARICSDLQFLGIIIDEKRNHNSERLISADGSGVGVHVIQAREDVSIIKQTVQALNQGA